MVIINMLEIFGYDFMQRAFISGMIVGLICPLIGMFIVVRRYSLLADTLAHVSLIGVAGAALFGINPILGALISSIIAAIGIEKFRSSKRVFNESILAVFLTGSLALALIILSMGQGQSINLISYLFGSIATVNSQDVLLVGILGMFVTLIIGILFKRLFLIAFDENIAEVSGINVKQINLILVITAAVTVSVSMRVVGVLLVGALMVIPVLTATQFKQGFTKTTIYALIFSLFSVVTGLFASFYLDLPGGATIVLVNILQLLLAILVNKSTTR